MRIAYYAWTDLQLFNCCNLRMNQYANDEAELFLLRLPRISEGLLGAVREAECFSRICEIVPTELRKPRNSVGRMLKLNVLCGQRAMKRYYEDAFKSAVGQTVFDRIVVAGFWAETSFLIEAVYRNNTSLRIDFIEEGMRHGKELFAYTLSTGIAARILRFFYDGYKVGRWRVLAERAFFYASGRFEAEAAQGFAYMALTSVTPENPRALTLLQKAMRDVDMCEYERRKVVIIEDPYFYARDENGNEIFMPQFIERIAEAVGARQLIVKKHPSRACFKDSGVEERIPGVFYDERTFFFEAALSRMGAEDKLVVINHSSLLLTLTIMLRLPIKIVCLVGLSGKRDHAARYMRDLIDGLQWVLPQETRLLTGSDFDTVFHAIIDTKES